ncbi:MAG: type I methionyl aminopeptidase [Bacteroidota bacterium]
MSIGSEEDFQGLQTVGEAVAITLKKMKEYAEIGMSTLELDEYGASILASYGAVSAPIKDYDFPGHTCISINQEACHGIPAADRILKDGDLVNIDVSAALNGYYGDNGSSFILGNDHQNLQPLVDASRDILYLALENVKHRVRIQDVGGLIEKEAKKRGFKVIRNICGHGIGRRLHEAPEEIACFRDRRNRERFKMNGVVAVETFISTEARYVYEEDDGWTLSTMGKGFVAQQEHTLIIGDGYPTILTSMNGI